MTIKILIADDQALVRAGFRMILEADPDLEVVTEVNDGAQAVEANANYRPDVVLMDIRMPVMDGITATRLMVEANPACRVVILTTYDLDEYVFDALRAGAAGFLLKDIAPEDLLTCIRTVSDGDSLLSPSITRRVIEAFVQDHPATRTAPGLDDLTARELEILRLVARGLSNVDIAQQLIVSPATVKTHVARVLDKLGLRNRIEAVVLAYESGVIRPGDTPP